VVSEYLTRLRSVRDVGTSEEARLASVIDRLHDLQNYPFTALEISAAVEEEQVGEIFVRINSKGVRLQQADFILTLLSVFWEEGRRTLESFCRDASKPKSDGTASPFNPIYTPRPAHLLRTMIAVALKRASLRRVYGVLRGRDAQTGEFSESARQAQFERLQATLPSVVDLTNWHEFLKCIAAAGYRREATIISKNAVVFAYALFLIGRVEFALSIGELRRRIARWFYAASVTARLTGSFETDMESLLGQVAQCADGNEFASLIERDISHMLTNDFWALILPERLATSAARSPALYAFLAAQCIFNAPVLFFSLSINALEDPLVKPKKKSLDRHHLFPKGHLKTIGVTKRRDVNQIANLTYVEWPDNVKIGARPPHEYVPEILENMNMDGEWTTMQRLHALPEDWWTMKYDDFLSERRRLMAALIREAFDKI